MLLSNQYGYVRVYKRYVPTSTSTVEELKAINQLSLVLLSCCNLVVNVVNLASAVYGTGV
jgi:hypothetical protein